MSYIYGSCFDELIMSTMQTRLLLIVHHKHFTFVLKTLNSRMYLGIESLNLCLNLGSLYLDIKAQPSFCPYNALLPRLYPYT